MGIDPARFDAELFHAAAAASRRFLGAAADDTPLICPLGLATLGSPKDLRKIVAMMNNLPGLKSGLVLEIPSDALVSDDVLLSGAGLIADSAIRLAVEGRLDARRMKEAIERFDVEFWSIAGSEIVAEDAGSLIAEGGEIKVVATSLAHDHEVVAMIDSGVTLVCGPRFSEPKPVKPLNASPPSGLGQAGGIS